MTLSTSLLVLVVLSLCKSVRTTWTIKDDLFKFPQFNIIFSDSFVTVEDASAKLVDSDRPGRSEIYRDYGSAQMSRNKVQDRGRQTLNSNSDETKVYERLILNGNPYLCAIPFVQTAPHNQTVEDFVEEDREKELMRAADKGRQLLKEMESNQCLFYTTGWWTYSFCYNLQVKQFHALPLNTKGARIWPPQEDPDTPSYILGKFDVAKSISITGHDESIGNQLTELRTKADTSYLVQRLEGGTPCDLTGKDRKVEVQFHCNPQLTDRIGWIKETATCAYLMIIYTPRLCNDVVFQPPKESKANMIVCQEILSANEILRLEGQEEQIDRTMIGQESEQRVFVGNIELGAMKYLGKNSKKIERGPIVLTEEEKGENAETIMMRKGGEVSDISKLDLKKLQLDRKYLEDFVEEVQDIAGAKDWRIEKLDDADGQVRLRVIVAVDDDNDDKEAHDTKQRDVDEDKSGSEEEYKKEL